MPQEVAEGAFQRALHQVDECELEVPPVLFQIGALDVHPHRKRRTLRGLEVLIGQPIHQSNLGAFHHVQTLVEDGDATVATPIPVGMPSDDRVLEVIRANRRLELMSMGEVMGNIDWENPKGTDDELLVVDVAV